MTWAGRALAVIAAMAFVSCLEPAQAPDPGDPKDSIPGPRHLSTFGAYAEIKAGDTLVFDGIRSSYDQMGETWTDSIVRTILVDSILQDPGSGIISIFHTRQDILRSYFTGYDKSNPSVLGPWRDSVFLGQRDTTYSMVDSYKANDGDAAIFANYDSGNPADTSLNGINRYLSGPTCCGIPAEPNMPLFRFWNTMNSTDRDSAIIVDADTVSGWSARETYTDGRVLNQAFTRWYFVVEKSKGLRYFVYGIPMRYYGYFWTWKRRSSR